MKNLKNIHRFINEWLDSPGSIDVPGQNSEIRVNSRNYKTQNQQLPEVFDAMFEAAYFHDFLDEEGRSEKFNKFLAEGKKSGAQVTGYIKDSFKDKASKKRN